MTTPTRETAPPAPKELATFTRQLGAMLAAGVDVLRALRIASQHSRNERLQAAARDIARRLEDGREFHQAIGPLPDLFDSFYVEMTRQGEADGQLGQALLAVADYLDRADGGAAAPNGPGGSAPAGVAGLTMTTLGVLALGAGAIWGVAAADLLPIAWLGPLAVAWAGLCLLAGGGLLRRLREPAARPTLPGKTPERRVAETEAVVRSALDEQAEEREPGPRSSPGLNGRSADLAKFEPDDAPRFE